MKLTYPKGKTIRFDFDISKADDVNNIPFTIEPEPLCGLSKDVKGKEVIGFLCRYRVYAVNKDNEEIIGYLRESTTNPLSFDTKETDLPIITKFCSDAFINVEIDFQEKIRLPYNIFGRARPDFDKMGASILQSLIDLGCY